MRPAEQLSTFIREALLRGASRDSIRSSLISAGWSETEVRKALAAWMEGSAPNLPPIPRPAPSSSAREALFYTLKFLALLVVIWTVVDIGFQLVDLAYRPQGTAYWRTHVSRWDIATLIIFAPLFVGLHLYNQILLRKDSGTRRSSLRRWLGNGALLVAALTILGDAVVVLGSWLSGEGSVGGLWKSAIVAVVAGAAALFFRLELADKDEE